jgi:histidinol-phosphatase
VRIGLARLGDDVPCARSPDSSADSVDASSADSVDARGTCRLAGMEGCTTVDPAAHPTALPDAAPTAAPDLGDDLALALRLAETADAITLSRFRAADLRVDRKPDRTPVTDADTAAEDALRAVLGTQRPGDAVLGEERGGDLPESGRGWVLDPIDGTKNFARGVPAWATLIGLTVQGRAVAGVVSAPALGRRWWGADGLGAWTSEAGGPPRRIAVSRVADLADAYLSTTDFRTFARHGELDRWLALADACWETRAFGDFWQYCLVAEGVIDVAVDRTASAWDLAALVPILAEAGGRLTDLSGTATHDGGNALASNGTVHDAALALLAG